MSSIKFAEWVVAAADDVATSPSFDAVKLRDFAFAITAVEDSAGALDVSVEDSFDGGTTWYAWKAFTQLTANGSEAVGVARPCGGLIRFRITAITGTWSFTVWGAANPLA